MKFINKIILMAFVVMTPLAGCDTEDLHELNINPQAFDEIDVNFLLTAAELGSASGGSAGDNRFIDWRMNIGFTGHMMQQIANAGGGIAPGDKYFNGEDGAWDFLWSDVGKNLAEILRQTGPGGFAEGKKKNTREAARILRAFNFHRLTDYYGNIPYTEAFKGITGTFFPKYDAQQTIYTDLLKELDEASAAISTSNADEGFAAADLLFDGDIAKWKKFGYSLMLRLAMRISAVDQATAATYVTKAVAGGVMASNADNAWIKMSLGPSEWTNQNGISRAFASGDGGQPSYLAKTFVDLLKATNDPRLMIFSGGTNGDMDPQDQVGLPNGYDPTTIKAYLGLAPSASVVMENYFAIINRDLLDDDDPYMIMNYAESEFLLAEAIERSIGTVNGTAAEHYDNGVKAAMQMYDPYFTEDQDGANPNVAVTVSDAQVATYLAAYPYTPGAAGLSQIGEQLWISKFFNWWDSWADWRRTGFPALTPVNYSGEMGSNVTNGKIPSKMRIPGGESSSNPNFEAGADLPNELTTKVWWDPAN